MKERARKSGTQYSLRESGRVIRSYGMTLPILALTANAIEGSRLDALEAGATEFLTKPILRENLHG